MDIRSINLDILEEQPGEIDKTLKFSSRTKIEDIKDRQQLSCYLTRTTLDIHNIIFGKSR